MSNCEYGILTGYERFYCRKSCGDCDVKNEHLDQKLLIGNNPNATYNECVDEDPRCCAWANKVPSECVVNQAYMLTSCRSSCKVCNTEIKVCVDDSRPGILTPGELKVLGGVLIITLAVCFIPYVGIIYIFTSNNEFNRILSYNMLSLLSLADMLQFLANFLQSLMMIFNSTFSCIISNFTASLLNLSPLVVCLMTLMVSVCRFVIIVFPQWGCPKTAALSFLIFLAGVIHLIVNFIPGYRGVLSSNIIEPVEEVHTRSFWNIANYVGYGAVYMASGLYVLSFLSLIYQRRVFNTTLMTKQEWRMFFQTVVPCWIKPVVMYIWVYQRASANSTFYYCLQMWLVVWEASYYPFVYIIANKTVRKALWKALTFKSSKEKSTIVSVMKFSAPRAVNTKSHLGDSRSI